MYEFSVTGTPMRFDSLRDANREAAIMIVRGYLPEVKRYPRIGSAEFVIRIWAKVEERYMWLVEVNR
jgi:hypothetical protein